MCTSSGSCSHLQLHAFSPYTDRMTFVLFYSADAPRIHTISQSVLLPVGNRLLLRCIASGVPAPRVTWVHHRHNLSVVPHLVLSHGRDIATGGVAGEANVTSAAVLAGDEGQYTCIARNVIAHHRQHLMVTLQCKLHGHL